jgi:hypothetical protein
MSIGKSSWGRYPRFPQTGHGIGWRSELPGELARVAAEHGTLLPFGNGRSYGDSCLATSDQVLHLRPLDRFISADWQTGVIRAEAGVTLDEVLRLAIPRGWFLSVTPGTKFATLGGAPNDVHGKNHTCAAASAPRAALRAGALRSRPARGRARRRRRPLRRHHRRARAHRHHRLGRAAAHAHQEQPRRCGEHPLQFAGRVLRPLAGARRPARIRRRLDRLRRPWRVGEGRGIYMVGDHAPEGGLAYDDKPKLSVPLVPPISAINSVSLRVFNHFYYNAAKPGRHQGAWAMSLTSTPSTASSTGTASTAPRASSSTSA